MSQLSVPGDDPVKARRAVTRGLLRQHQEALNRHDVQTLAGLYAEDAVLESPMFHQVRGRAGIAASFSRLFALFPDYTIALTEALFMADDDRVAEFSTVTGTQSIEFFGLPVTSEPIEYQSARLFTIRDGQIVHERRVYDFQGVLDRLEKVRIDREMALATVVQHTLCRSEYAASFCTFVASSLPCRAIGGDFVEYLELSSGALGLAVGDVAGKGPASALVAAMLQGMFSMVATMGEATPSEVLTRLNRALYARGVHPKFATLVYGVLSPAGIFTYSNAGHQPPLLVTSSAVKVLGAGGPILGVFEDAEFPGTSVSLASGDRIVLFSDGVTDATAPDGTDFGMSRLIETVASGRSQPTAETLLGYVLHGVEQFSSTAPVSDDITIAVLAYRDQREGPGPVPTPTPRQ